MKIYFTFKKPKNIKYLLLDDLSEELIDYLKLIKNETLIIKYKKRPVYLSFIFFFILIKNYFKFFYSKKKQKLIFFFNILFKHN